MTLKLNITEEDKRDEGFKEYFGKNIEQRPLIVAANRIPMRVAHLMGMRILHPKSDWMSNYFDCDDRIAYHSGGERLKIGSRGELKDYGKYGKLVKYAIEFDDANYDRLPWKEMNKGELILDGVSREQSKTHMLWFELSQRNQGLLDAFVETVYRVGKYREAMSVCLEESTRARSWMRAACVYGLELWSRFGGWFHLGDDNGRLVGVAPEALVRLERRLKDEKKITVDFVGALGEVYQSTGATRAPIEVKSKSGFMNDKKYDIEVGDAESERRFPESEVQRACEIALQSGQTTPEKVIEVVKRQLLARGNEHE